MKKINIIHNIRGKLVYRKKEKRKKIERRKKKVAMNCKLSMQSGDQLGVTLSSRRLGAVWGYSWLSYSGSASAVEWLEARDAAEHPTIHRTAPITKDYVTQNVNHAELKKKKFLLYTSKQNASRKPETHKKYSDFKNVSSKKAPTSFSMGKKRIYTTLLPDNFVHLENEHG